MSATVTARAFIGFARMVRNDFGPEKWDEVVASMGEPEREIYAKKINSIIYLPYENYLAVIEALRPLYGGGDAGYRKIGGNGAVVDFETIFQIFAKGEPGEFIQNGNFFWSNYYRGLGNLKPVITHENRGRLLLEDGEEARREHMMVVAGWMEAILRQMKGDGSGTCDVLEDEGPGFALTW